MQAGQFGTQSYKSGGGIPVFSDLVTGLYQVGGVLSPDRLPDVGNRLSAATPISIDEATGKIDIHYAFEVVETAAADAVSYKVKKHMNNTIAKVGMPLMKMPAAVTTAGAAYAVTAIDKSNADYDIITLGTTLGALAIGDVLVEADSAGATGKKIRVLPNLMSFYDIEKLAYTDNIHFNGIYHFTGLVYENRISPVAKIIRDYMMANGCWFRFTKQTY